MVAGHVENGNPRLVPACAARHDGPHPVLARVAERHGRPLERVTTYTFRAIFTANSPLSRFGGSTLPRSHRLTLASSLKQRDVHFMADPLRALDHDCQAMFSKLKPAGVYRGSKNHATTFRPVAIGKAGFPNR